MPDTTSWELALMRSRLATLERKAEQPHADTGTLLADYVKEIRGILEFLDAAAERSRGAEAQARTAQGAVRHAQERFRQTVELMPDAFVATDLAGMIVEVNATAGRLLNLSPRALRGRPLHIFLNGERVEFLKFLADLPTAEEPHQRQLRLRPRERHHVTVAARVGVVRDDEQRAVALHWILLQGPHAQPEAVREQAAPVLTGTAD